MIKNNHSGVSPRYALALLLFFLLAVGAFAQTLHGTVTDRNTGEPIIGATISLTAETSGRALAVTDTDGKFTVAVKYFPATLIISYTGYKREEYDVFEVTKDNLDIHLAEDFSALGEVVVIGYGTQKRQDLVSAISNVNKSLLSQPASSVEAVLAGSVAGINVTQTSGQPGAASNIRIRGGNSITGGNEPLYVIDGFIVYNDLASNRTGAVGSDATLDPLSFLNPSDIENIEVLKDVSATAIYGTRGANGVILITTKKGSRGYNKVNYTGSFGWSTAAKKLDFLNAGQFTDLYNELSPGNKLPAPTASYDWQEAAFRTASSQEHQLSFLGGDDKSRYSVSGGYKNQSGIILGTGLERFSGRINFERNLTGAITFGVNASGAYSKLKGLRNVDKGNSGQTAKWAANSWMSVITTPTTQAIYNADGSFNYSPTPVSQDIFSRNGESVVGNPVSDLLNTQTLTKNTRIIGNAYLQWEVASGLTLKGSLGADLSNTKEDNYAPSYTTMGLEYNGVASVGSANTNVWLAELTATYDRYFDKVHHLTVLGGYTAQRTKREISAVTVRNLANDLTGYNNLSAASDFYAASSYAAENTLKSLLGRVNYSYNERYNASVTLRADGSSRFSKNHKWGWFPSVGLSWNIDKEPWVRLGKQVDYLQFRLSAGAVGNQEIGDYQYDATIATTSQKFIYNGAENIAYYISNPGNPDLKWERTASYNAGLTSGFFNNRLTVTLDAYYKKTTDLLLQVPVEQVTGFDTSLRNVGSVTNKGVELEIGAALVRKKNTSWNVNLNLAHNANEVASLGNVESIIPDFSGATLGYITPVIITAGQPLGTFYGYKFKGIVQKDQDISQLPAQSVSALEPGNPIYEDVNDDGVVNTADQTVLGNSQPKLTYGFNTSLKYRQWDFFLNVAGSLGNKLYNALATRLTKGSTYYNSLAVVAERWTEDNPSTTIQKASDNLTVLADSRYVEDASYLRVKNIQLGYTWPLRQVAKDASLRLSLSLQNFLTITGYSGYDPEASRNGMDEHSALYQGVDMATYPPAKTVLLGISLTL
jgi:TonB-linked SusC/RagA family outer membrane protein